MKNLHLFIPQFFEFDETLIRVFECSRSFTKSCFCVLSFLNVKIDNNRCNQRYHELNNTTQTKRSFYNRYFIELKLIRKVVVNESMYK